MMVCRTFTFNGSWTAILTLSLLLTVSTARSRADDQVENIDRDSLTDLVVELTDEQGEPVVGAAVRAYAMRMREPNTGHGYWNSEKLGPPKSVYSDDRGIAIVKYPAKVASSPSVLTTSLVSFEVLHSDFVRQVVHFDLGPEKAEVTLKRGCEIQISAIDQDREPVEDFAVLVAGPLAPALWADDGNGGRRTSAASDGVWQAMIVKPQADGRTLFSGVLPLRVRPRQAVRIRNVQVKPGVQINGVLSGNVPRPVRAGYVISATAPLPANDSYSDESPSLVWMQWEPVAEDGTFTLPSIPRSGKIQIIALSEGWLSKTTLPDAQVFVMGQLFDIEDDTEMDVTVEMEQTGTVELLIEKPDGSKLTEGSVSSWPNQRYYLGGSTYLGSRYNSMWFVEQQLAAPDQRVDSLPRDSSYIPFLDQPVRDGSAVLRGLPVDRQVSFALQHPDYFFASQENRRGVSAQIKSAEPIQMKVRAQPIPK